MAAGAGVDQNDRCPGSADTGAVVRRSLIAFQHEQRQLLAEVADGPLQQRCLAGAGRADEIDREDFPPGEPRPVLRRQRVVLGEDFGFEFDDVAGTTRSPPLICPLMIRPVIIMIVAMMMVVAMLMSMVVVVMLMMMIVAVKGMIVTVVIMRVMPVAVIAGMRMRVRVTVIVAMMLVVVMMPVALIMDVGGALRRAFITIEHGHGCLAAAATDSAHERASSSSMVLIFSSSPRRRWSLRDPQAQAA
jgi:hypothetical protein